MEYVTIKLHVHSKYIMSLNVIYILVINVTTKGNELTKHQDTNQILN